MERLLGLVSFVCVQVHVICGYARCICVGARGQPGIIPQVLTTVLFCLVETRSPIGLELAQ